MPSIELPPKMPARAVPSPILSAILSWSMAARTRSPGSTRTETLELWSLRLRTSIRTSSPLARWATSSPPNLSWLSLQILRPADSALRTAAFQASVAGRAYSRSTVFVPVPRSLSWQEGIHRNAAEIRARVVVLMTPPEKNGFTREKRRDRRACLGELNLGAGQVKPRDLRGLPFRSCPMYDVGADSSPLDVERDRDLLRAEGARLRPGLQRNRQRRHRALQRGLRPVRVGVEREDRPDQLRRSVDR